MARGKPGVLLLTTKDDAGLSRIRSKQPGQDEAVVQNRIGHTRERPKGRCSQRQIRPTTGTSGPFGKIQRYLEIP